MNVDELLLIYIHISSQRRWLKWSYSILNDPKVAAANPQAVVAMSKALSEYVEQKMTESFVNDMFK